MRANTSVILNHPGYSTLTGTDGKQWGRIVFPSLRDAHIFTKTHCRTVNESAWYSPDFVGLKTQTIENFDETGSSREALRALNNAKATISEPRLTFGRPLPSITGAVWDVPAVLANVPLAARTRTRTRLAPLSFHFLFSAACSLDAAEMGQHGARLAAAVNAYVLAGGVVNITFSRAAYVTRGQSTGNTGLIVECTINTQDEAELALAFSPAFVRGIAAPIITAASTVDYDGLPVLNSAPIAGAIYCGGPPQNFRQRMREACEALRIE